MYVATESSMAPLENEDTHRVFHDGVEDVTLRAVSEIEYQPDEGVRYYDVVHGDAVVGNLDIAYDYELRQVRIDDITIDQAYRHKGLGKALYRTVLQLPLPTGQKPREQGFVHVTDHHSAQAAHVWESLAREGTAVKTDSKSGYVIQ